MERKKQLSVSLENKPGTLARLCRGLADCRINVLALSVVETTEHSLVRLVVDKPEDAVKLLEEECCAAYAEREVLLLDLPNKVGVIADIAEKLAAKKVNIDFLYGSTAKGRGKTFVVLGAANLKAAQKALAGA